MMNNIIIIKGNKQYRNDNPFIYIADTAWSIITNSSIDEWDNYLHIRKAQGFNTIQFNLLPQWDRSMYLRNNNSVLPFECDKHSRFIVNKPNHEYFDKVKLFLDKMTEYDMVPSVVLLWCDYIEGTWCYENSPYSFAKDDIEHFVSFTYKLINIYNPIYLISGDTNLDNTKANEIYNIAIDTLHSLDEHAVMGIHVAGGGDCFPYDLHSDKLSFFMYQSGHTLEGQDLTHKIPAKLMEDGYDKPIINGEICYEGHKISVMDKSDITDYGVFAEGHVRNATYKSFFSGSFGGIAYGAHGVWNWHKEGMIASNVEFAGEPPRVDEVLYLYGVDDIKFFARIVDKFMLWRLNERAMRNQLNILICKSSDAELFAIYIPQNEMLLKADLDINTADYDWYRVDIDKKQINNYLWTKDDIPQRRYNSMIIIGELRHEK